MEEAKKQALDALNVCEKHMVAMIEVSSAKDKFYCVLFRKQFQNRIKEKNDEVKNAPKACEQMR